MPKFVASFEAKIKLAIVAVFLMLMWVRFFNILSVVLVLTIANIVIWKWRWKKKKELENHASINDFGQTKE